MKKLLFVFTLAWGSLLQAAPAVSFNEYVQSLKLEAKAQGIGASTVDASFVDVRFIERAVKNDRNQPEFKLTLDSYLPQAVPEWKVRQAQRLYREHYALLQRIGTEYGVQPRFIVALWGIETNFGKLTGKYSLISALSTLAYEGRREAFFKKELFAALRIIEQGHATPQTLKGSWAGAMGQVQFMPSSFLAYAVDQDGDGRKDLWHTQADVFASAAYYLQQHGWKENETWARRVRAPRLLDPALVGLETSKSVAQWRALGVVNLDGSALPAVGQQASLVMPDDKEGRAYLAYDNYKALMGWNRSNYFVVAVGYLADRIVGKS
jgi:membrane-bound lytic murein transglycosylase B